jgi:hypothetical protein
MPASPERSSRVRACRRSHAAAVFVERGEPSGSVDLVGRDDDAALPVTRLELATRGGGAHPGPPGTRRGRGPGSRRTRSWAQSSTMMPRPSAPTLTPPGRRSPPSRWSASSWSRHGGDRVAVEVEHADRPLVPGGHDRVGPEVAAALVVDVPADRLVVGITGEVVGRVDLDPVPVVVAEVQVERVRHAVAAGPALDVLREVAGADHVAQAEDVVRLGHGERDVVQHRAACRA